MLLVYLIRHGETLWNRSGRLQGTLDIPLSEQGKDQARSAARFLSKVRVIHLYTSPQGRALETARIIGEAVAKKPEVIPELREISFGELEGLSPEEVERRYPGFHLRFRWGTGPVEFPGGENEAEFQERMTGLLEKFSLEEKHHSEGGLLVVTHGQIIRGLLGKVLGIPRKTRNLIRLGNASISILGIDDSWFCVEMINGTTW